MVYGHWVSKLILLYPNQKRGSEIQFIWRKQQYSMNIAQPLNLTWKVASSERGQEQDTALQQVQVATSQPWCFSHMSCRVHNLGDARGKEKMLRAASVKPQGKKHDFVGQEFRKGWAGQFSIEISHVVPTRCWLGTASSEGQRAGLAGWRSSETLHPAAARAPFQQCGLRMGTLPPQQLASLESERFKRSMESAWPFRTEPWKSQCITSATSDWWRSQIQGGGTRNSPPLSERNVRKSGGPILKHHIHTL